MIDKKIKLGGKDVTLETSWRTSTDIYDNIADPLFMADEAAKQEILSKKGLGYEPKFAFDINNMVSLLHIVIKEDLSRDEVGKLVLEHGFIETRLVCVDYIVSLLNGPKEIKVKSTSKKK